MVEKVEIQVEKCVIGALLIDSNAYSEISDILSTDDFESPVWREIYTTIATLANEGKTADMLTVAQILTGKIEFIEIACISESVATSAMVREHALQLREISDKRKIWQLCTALAAEAKNPTVTADEIREKLQGALQEGIPAGVRSFRDILKDVNSTVEKNLAGGEKSGISTGWPYIDEKGRFRLGNLVIIAGDTSQGKTAFALSIAKFAASTGTPTTFYSLEMTSQELGTRVISMHSGIRSLDIATRPLAEHDIKKIDEAATRLCDIPLYIDERSTSRLENIMGSIRRLVKRFGVRLVFVDYLQILGISDKGVNREQQLADAARKLKNLAKDLNIVIVALSQLNRNIENPEPSKDRVRDSAQIVDACDILLMVYRPEFYGRKYSGEYANVDTHNTAQIKLEKGRNMGVGSWICGFVPELTMFYPLDRVPYITEEKKKTGYFANI